MLLVHSGTVSTLRTRGFPYPAYNLITRRGRADRHRAPRPGRRAAEPGRVPARLAGGDLRPPRRPVRPRTARDLARRGRRLTLVRGRVSADKKMRGACGEHLAAAWRAAGREGTGHGGRARAGPHGAGRHAAGCWARSWSSAAIVSGPALAVALAEQYGVELDTERGFGTGLWAEIDRRHRAGAGPEPEERTRSGQRRQARAGAPRRASRSSATPSPSRPRARAARGREPAAAGRDRAPARRVHEAEARRDARVPEPSSHLLFVPTPERYLLVERDGAPPAPGAELELRTSRRVRSSPRSAARRFRASDGPARSCCPRLSLARSGAAETTSRLDHDRVPRDPEVAVELVAGEVVHGLLLADGDPARQRRARLRQRPAQRVVEAAGEVVAAEERASSSASSRPARAGRRRARCRSGVRTRTCRAPAREPRGAGRAAR